MTRFVEFTGMNHDGTPAQKVLLRPENVVAAMPSVYGDGFAEPNAPPCVTIWTVASGGSTIGHFPLKFYVRESYDEVKAKLMEATG